MKENNNVRDNYIIQLFFSFFPGVVLGFIIISYGSKLNLSLAYIIYGSDSTLVHEFSSFVMLIYQLNLWITLS